MKHHICYTASWHATNIFTLHRRYWLLLQNTQKQINTHTYHALYILLSINSGTVISGSFNSTQQLLVWFRSFTTIIHRPVKYGHYFTRYPIGSFDCPQVSKRAANVSNINPFTCILTIFLNCRGWLLVVMLMTVIGVVM